MRTRALFYVVLGALILGALLVLDLVAHGFTAIQGVVFELVRAGLQGVAMLWLARALEILYFRTSSVSRAEEARLAADWPVRLVQRFAIILGLLALSALAPFLFGLSTRNVRVPGPFAIEPITFPTVISIDILGAFWLMLFVFAMMSFWQINLVRQSPRFARRRFVGWAIAAGALSLFALWQAEDVVPNTAITVTVFTVLLLSTGLGALLIGYRLAWLPHASRVGKRKLLAFSAIDALLATAALVAFGGDKLQADQLFERYALFWQMAALATFGTLAIYFAMVFFSTLFSLSSTELVERKSAEVQSLAKLTRFSSDILSSELLLDLPKLAEQITSLACEATESDCAWLELRSTNEGEEPVRCYVGIGEMAAERIMEEAEGFPEAGRQITSPRSELDRTRRPIILRKRISTQQYLFPSPAQALANKELHSMVAVPMLRKDEVRGGLYVAKHREDGFDEDDLTMLTAFSDVASLALETARLLQDSIEKQKFDGELRAARLMQKSLLPERFPNVPGFDIYAISIPAYDVGGDFYDSSILWDGSPMITIGDVSGKGISASLYMAETKGVVQALAPVMANMTALLEDANEALMHNSPSITSFRRSFVTLGLIAFTKKGVTYARAGHTPLLHVRADGTHQFYQPRGIAVGLIRHPDLAEAMDELTLDLHQGDVLVLFSDGITDARSPAMEHLGYERLAKFVAENLEIESSRDLTLKVLQSVAEFTQSGNFDDDATLVVMRCISDERT